MPLTRQIPNWRSTKCFENLQQLDNNYYAIKWLVCNSQWAKPWSFTKVNVGFEKKRKILTWRNVNTAISFPYLQETPFKIKQLFEKRRHIRVNCWLFLLHQLATFLGNNLPSSCLAPPFRVDPNKTSKWQINKDRQADSILLTVNHFKPIS